MYNKIILSFLILLITQVLLGQSCHFQISGSVYDLNTGFPMQEVSVEIPDIKSGTYTDSLGQYVINNICFGQYHLQVSHIGCETEKYFIDIKADTILDIWLDHASHELEAVEIDAQQEVKRNPSQTEIKQKDIEKNAEKSLTQLISSMPGVSSISNGNSISKPVINGMYGNRLSILNNGIAQSGQQWGNDHSPEIDPNVAAKIRLVHGAESLKYPGTNLGTILLVEPKPIGHDPHLHGRVSGFYDTNGRQFGSNIQAQTYNKFLSWKFNGTIKKGGDRFTPSYFLTNTGNREYDGSLQLEKSISDKTFSTLYLSSFNSQLGILRGSHIGNLNDLEEAFYRDEPFFTSEKFSYNIEAPNQKVNHHLAKLDIKHFLNVNAWIDYTLSSQLNERKEFDVRRGGRSDIPALSLNQWNHYASLTYNNEDPNKNWYLYSGLQVRITDNTNRPNTGILPLIPDYIEDESTAFLVLKNEKPKHTTNLGIKYSFVYQYVARIETGPPLYVQDYKNTYHNFSIAAGHEYLISKTKKISGDLFFSTRNPAINELYSNGLHQGVSGIELGNITLNKEKSLRATLGYSTTWFDKLKVQGQAYYQYINDFIYLLPSDELRLTIRGAFPVYQYEQTNGRFVGLDTKIAYNILKYTDIVLSGSYLSAKNTDTGQGLVYMPANNLRAEINLEYPNPQSHSVIKNFNFTGGVLHNFKKTDIDENQDFLPVPEAYSLLYLSLGGDFRVSEKTLSVTLKVDNLLNTKYRDYLNRLHYFADEMGRNISMNLSYEF